MKSIIAFFPFALIFLQAEAQYFGGNRDGYSVDVSPVMTLNVQSFYCSGGDKDGYTLNPSGHLTLNVQNTYCGGGNKDGYDDLAFFAGSFYDQSVYCSGGDKDGYHRTNFFQGILNEQTFYCSGGNRDGYGRDDTMHVTFNNQVLYCSGGDNEGYDHAGISPVLLFDQSWYCSGGNRDGYSNILMSLDSLGKGIWTGSFSSSWDWPANWAHNIVPDSNDMVFIPQGCAYYPYLTAGLAVNDTGQTYLCKSLEIEAGAQLTSENSTTAISGRVLVGGEFTAINSLDAAQVIHQGGSLAILSNGIVRLGNQSTGSGNSDLVVDQGGVLEVQGGVLEIDDQLNIRGTFNMTGGNVFAHKYGAGSAITLLAGPFNVAPGASGNISGGILRICGKTGSNFAAIALNDPDFDFTGTSSLIITNGISPARSDVAIQAVNGASFQNLVIIKPGYDIRLTTNATIHGGVTVFDDATLTLAGGKTITLTGNMP